MSAITVEVPDDLAEQLRSLEEQLPRILELGLRQLHAEAQPGYEGAAEVFEFLASVPSPEQILAFRPSEKLQERLRELLAKLRDADLSSEEQREWQQFQYLEHLVRLAKANALKRLKSP
jgi:hypothetical protein